MTIRVMMGLGLFVASLALGWGLHRVGALTEPRAARLVRWVVRWSSPTVLCLSFWGMDLARRSLWLLPCVGLISSLSTLVPALYYAKRAGLTMPQTGSFLTCACFSNIGYFGAFTAFAMFGEPGYALCILYMVFFTPWFYTLGFWLATFYGRASGRAAARDVSAPERLRLYPFLGMLLGLSLNAIGVPRPSAAAHLNRLLIPLDTGLYLLAIGSQISLTPLRPWLRPCLAMSAIKFLYTPVIAWLLADLFRFNGLARQVVLLEASTPVAVSPLVLPLLFGLDRRLSNALWWVTTLVAIPWFMLLLPFLRVLY